MVPGMEGKEGRGGGGGGGVEQTAGVGVREAAEEKGDGGRSREEDCCFE
jgi:hypothetical protein